jgi:outer membrane protein assembly factor BamD
MKLMKPLLLLVLVLTFSACQSKYEKLLKSSDYDLKYTKAKEYFEKGKYENSVNLFEELMQVYRGTDKGEEAHYYYAYSEYNIGNYDLAGYYFRQFTRNYAGSKHAEECAYLVAYCYYLNSPKYNLDQQDTKNAINEMQVFIENYPNSNKQDTANEIIDKLRIKLETKSFETSKQYILIEDYKAGLVELKNFLKDYPDSKMVDEANYLIVKGNYLLYQKSIESKKEERLNNVIESYLKFVDLYPNSAFLKDAEGYYNLAQKNKNKIVNNN